MLRYEKEYIDPLSHKNEFTIANTEGLENIVEEYHGISYSPAEVQKAIKRELAICDRRMPGVPLSQMAMSKRETKLRKQFNDENEWYAGFVKIWTAVYNSEEYKTAKALRPIQNTRVLVREDAPLLIDIKYDVEAAEKLLIANLRHFYPHDKTSLNVTDDIFYYFLGVGVVTKKPLENVVMLSYFSSRISTFNDNVWKELAKYHNQPYMSCKHIARSYSKPLYRLECNLENAVFKPSQFTEQKKVFINNVVKSITLDRVIETATYEGEREIVNTFNNVVVKDPDQIASYFINYKSYMKQLLYKHLYPEIDIHL